MKHYTDIGEAVKAIQDRDVQHIRPNQRSNALEVTSRRNSYKNHPGGVDFYLFLKGNGTKYVILVFDDMLKLYTDSAFQREEVGYTDGIKVKTQIHRGERVRFLDIGFLDWCSRCENDMLYNEYKCKWYCPLCE